jgi:hypothetical protein
MDHPFPPLPAVRARIASRFLTALVLAGAVGFAPRPTLSADDPPPARFTAVNRSRYRIHAVHACSPRAATWGKNLIEGRVLEPSRDVAVVLRGGCGVYDLRFVAEDGIEFLEDEVPFCGDDADQAEAAAGTGPQEDAEDVVTLGRNDLVKARRPRGVTGAGEGGRR